MTSCRRSRTRRRPRSRRLSEPRRRGCSGCVVPWGIYRPSRANSASPPLHTRGHSTEAPAERRNYRLLRRVPPVVRRCHTRAPITCAPRQSPAPPIDLDVAGEEGVRTNTILTFWGVDILHQWCRHSTYYDRTARTLPYRAAPRHARLDHPPDPALGTATRLRHRADDPGLVTRRAPGRHRLALPCPAPA